VLAWHFVLWHRSSDFARRFVLYTRLDGQFSDRTRFFAAAAQINAALAALLEFLPAIRASRSFRFLNEVGAALEVDNLAYARQICRRTPIRTLDHDLVCAEQWRLQRYVLLQQTRCPQQWEFIRSEINALLNDRYAVICLSRWCQGEELFRVLREVREHLGSELDFSTESHRIRIGLRLVEHIRREAPSP
jgi:hypothetical protein